MKLLLLLLCFLSLVLMSTARKEKSKTVAMVNGRAKGKKFREFKFNTWYLILRNTCLIFIKLVGYLHLYPLVITITRACHYTSALKDLF